MNQHDFDLNNEQLRALSMDLNGVVLVKGVAGSGKTTIAILRAEQLIQDQKQDIFASLSSKYKVAIFTYNKSLSGYIRSLLSDSSNIEISNIHKYAYGIFRKYYSKDSLIQKNEYQNIIQSFVNQENISSNLANKSIDFFLDEIIWIKDMMIKSYDEYINTKRKGREGRLSDSDKQIVWNIFIKFFQQYQKKYNKFLFSDFPCLAMKFMSDPIFDAIIIDEAQDLSKASLVFLSKLVKPERNSIMILMDAAQSIYQNGITWKSVGLTVHGSRSIELKQNYRNPLSVYQVAKCIIDKVNNKEDFIQDKAQCAKYKQLTEKPYVILCNTLEKQYWNLLEILKNIGLDNSSSVVILSKNKDHLKNVRILLTNNQINYTDINVDSNDKTFSIQKSIYLCTMHSIKGFEFDYVIILNANENILSVSSDDEDLNDKNRKLLYTALTRATKNAYILSSENSYSIMLDDIEDDLVNKIDYR